MNKLCWYTVAVLLVISAQSRAEPSPRLQDVRDIVAELKLSRTGVTVEDTLQLLFKKFPSLNERYVLVRNSKSRQKASDRYPRVIVYSSDASFVVTFNGDSTAPGYNEIEMYEFSEDPSDGLGPESRRESFKFQRVVFGENTAEVKPVNEKLCRSCHGGARDPEGASLNIRPNWESYNRWPGTYFLSDRRHSGGQFSVGSGSGDYEAFEQFYQHAAKKGRYRLLTNIDDKYVRPTKLDQRVPTSDFTQRVAHLNYRRLAHLLTRTADYELYKYAILGAVYDCREFAQMLPPTLKAEFRKPYVEYLESTANLFAANENAFHLKHRFSQIAKFRYLMEGRGISMRKWSTNFRRSPYAFVTPGGGLDGFLSSILMELDPDLEPFRLYRHGPDSYYGWTSKMTKKWEGSSDEYRASTCQGLREKSCELFSSQGYTCEDRRLWQGPRTMAGLVSEEGYFPASLDQTSQCFGLLQVAGESSEATEWGCLVANEKEYKFQTLPAARFARLAKNSEWPLRMLNDQLASQLFTNLQRIADEGQDSSSVLESQYFSTLSIPNSQVRRPEPPPHGMGRMILFGGPRRKDVPAPSASVFYDMLYWNEKAGFGCQGDMIWNGEAYKPDMARSPRCVIYDNKY